ncbi:MAG TPA: NAD(P)-dependent oxidoreductase [Acidisarcina sp.]
MLRVGIPDWVDPGLLHLFPDGIELVSVPARPAAKIAVDFWVAPLTPHAASEMVQYLEGVKVVQSLLAGVDWLLKVVPAGSQVWSPQVCDAQGVHNVATAEWVIAAILASLKYMPFYAGLQAAGDWASRKEADQAYRSLHDIAKALHPPVLVEELARKRVLIVGYGSIGRSIEERLMPFDVEIIRVARNARPAVPGPGVEPVSALKALLSGADVVVLIVPLTAETTGMIAAEELALMKRGALLINAARGPVVATDALIEALHSGRIRAAIDVTDLNRYRRDIRFGPRPTCSSHRTSRDRVRSFLRARCDSLRSRLRATSPGSRFTTSSAATTDSQ